MSTFSLSSAELAVLVDHMTGGRLLESEQAPAGLALETAAAEAVEQQLLDRGLLLTLPFEETAGVTSQLASVLSAAITPEQVCVVRSIQQEHTDPPVTFSFTPECISRNRLDGEGRHEFSELADRDAALDGILAAGGAEQAASVPRAEQPRPLPELLERAERLVTVLIVRDPAEEQAEPHSLAWVITDGGLWMVDPASDGENPTAVPVGTDQLRERIGEALGG